MTDFKIRYQIQADGRNARAELNNVDKLIDQMGAKARTGGNIGEIFGGNLAANAVSKLSGALLEGGQAVLDYSSRMEQTKIGFETLMGGAANAQQHLSELKRFAAATPFEFEDLTRASRRLQNVGLEGKKVIPVMQDIGNAAAAAGASSSELDSITLAFSQIIAKGKLSAEEVNQLAERGIPVWRMLEQQLGRSKGEIIKLAEQGKISSEVFLDAFRKFSQANFGDAMAKQSKTFSGAMSSIKDATMETAAVAFKPLYDEVSKFAVKVAESLGKQQAQANEAGVSFGKSLGTAVGVGLQQSGTGQDGYWNSWFFGPSALMKIGQGAYDFGKAYGEGARQGFNDAAGTTLPTTGWGKATLPAAPPPGTTPAIPPAAAPKVNTIEVGQYKMTQQQINELALQGVQDRNRREFDLWDANQQTIIARFKADLAIKAISEKEYQTKVREYEDERLAGTLANLEIEKKKRVELGMNTREIDNDIAIQKAAIETQMHQRRADDADRKREDEQKELDFLEKKQRAWTRFLNERERELKIQEENDAKHAAYLRSVYEAGTVMGGRGLGGAIGGGLGVELVPMFDEATNAMIGFQERLALVSDDINNFVGVAIGGMIEGLTQMATTWLMTGEFSAKAALQMVAGQAIAIAIESYLKGVFEIAEASAAFARFDFVSGGAHMAAAGLYFKTSALAGAIGVGAGLAGRAVGGGGSGSGASGGGGSPSSSNNRQPAPQPYSRQSDDVYISGRRNDPQTAALIKVIDKLDKKISMSSPGDVVTRGVKQRPGLIGSQVVADINRNASLGSTLLRKSGAR